MQTSDFNLTLFFTSVLLLSPNGCTLRPGWWRCWLPFHSVFCALPQQSLVPFRVFVQSHHLPHDLSAECDACGSSTSENSLATPAALCVLQSRPFSMYKEVISHTLVLLFAHTPTAISSYAKLFGFYLFLHEKSLAFPSQLRHSVANYLTCTAHVGRARVRAQ